MWVRISVTLGRPCLLQSRPLGSAKKPASLERARRRCRPRGLGVALTRLVLARPSRRCSRFATHSRSPNESLPLLIDALLVLPKAKPTCCNALLSLDEAVHRWTLLARSDGVMDAKSFGLGTCIKMRTKIHTFRVLQAPCRFQSAAWP